MPHLTAASARAFDLHAVTFNSFSATRTGARDLAAWRADIPPHTPGQPHRMSREEVLFVLSGVLSVEIEEDRFDAHAGDAVLIPEQARFCVANPTEEPASAWVVTGLGMTATIEGVADPIAPPWAQ